MIDNAGPPAVPKVLVNKKILLDLIGLLLIALVVVVGYKLSPLLLPRSDLTVKPDPACNLQQQACNVSLPGGGSLQLDVGTRPVPLIRPFDIMVTLDGVKASRVMVDLAGVDMDMGLNRPQLTEQAPGRFSGSATLPVCVTGRMVWQATVLLDTATGTIAAPFRFVSGA